MPSKRKRESTRPHRRALVAPTPREEMCASAAKARDAILKVRESLDWLYHLVDEGFGDCEAISYVDAAQAAATALREVETIRHFLAESDEAGRVRALRREK